MEIYKLLSYKEMMTSLHGMGLGAGFLLLFSAGFFAIWNLGAAGLAPDAVARKARHLALGTWIMAILVWATVLVGTYMIYPWYRAKPPAGALGAEALAGYPKYKLTWDPKTPFDPKAAKSPVETPTDELHEFGMEWKEHIAWISPILLTAVAAIMTCAGRAVAREAGLRRMVLFLFTVAFACASVAGVMGALLNKAAPTR